MDIPTTLQFLQRNPYIWSIIIVISFIILSKIIVHISERYLKRIAKKTKTEIDDIILERGTKPLSWIIFFIGIRVAILPLNLIPAYEGAFHNIINSIIIFFVVWIVIVLFEVGVVSWAEKLTAKTKSDFDDAIMPLFRKTVKIVLFLIGIMYIMSVWGIEVGPILASLGVAGLAVAFALQNTLSNIFGGVSIIIDKTFKVGDVIEWDQDMGTVQAIGLRSTKIKTFDGDYVIVPNGRLMDSRVRNLNLPKRSVRITINFGVEYGSDIKKVEDLVLKTIKSVTYCEEDPEPYIIFETMGESSLNFIARFWVANLSDKLPAIDEANRKVYDALNKAKIGIPFPTRTLYMRK